MKSKPGILGLLKPYRGLLFLLILLTLAGNGINLLIPKIISTGIDSFNNGTYDFHQILTRFAVAVVGIFVFGYLQSLFQTYTSEKVARDLRDRLSSRIANQSYAFVESSNPSKLLTNMTADVDSIKMFISQAIVMISSSLFIILGVSVLLFTINWKLALCVVAIIPIIGVTFAFVLKKVRALFVESRAVIDWLNKVINESILGAAIIRVVNAQQSEYAKFMAANEKAKFYGLSILNLFAALIPVITFTANMATLSILVLGGRFVINGSMSLGDIAAFNSYLSMLVFPILVIGFMSNVIAQASAAYQRIRTVLEAPDPVDAGTIVETLQGAISVSNLSLKYGESTVLDQLNFRIQPGTRNAVIGPTAAGKSQLLYVLMGLVNPTEGQVLYDGKPLDAYKKEAFYRRLGFVFQDSVIFNMSIRENIAFNEVVTEESMQRAIATAELSAFIKGLPEGMETTISERGSDLSGGQKQRIMLARALAIEPSILLLDDFTARLDNSTEQKILHNIRTNYPGITLLSVTQKIASVTDYDQVIFLMEGELIAAGTHQELLERCPEYVQMFHSQKSTSSYELQS